MSKQYKKLVQRLGYQFSDSAMLQQALTHRSASNAHNERLEFLGDAILSFIVTETLFERFPKVREGELTRMRAHLVKGDTLAEIARELDIGDYLVLGSGELKSGGWRRTSILADAVEAIIGAIYCDGGLEACKTIVLHLFQTRLAIISPQDFGKDPKTLLQEYLQAQKLALPTYEVLAVEGDAHDQWFQIICHVPGLAEAVQGSGKSRRYAEQAAAAQALQLLDIRA